MNVIVSPRLRNAITCRRSVTVAARNSVSSNTSGSGQNVIVVPVCPRFDAATARSFPCGTPGRAAARPLPALDRVLLPVRVAVAVDFEHQLRRQRVHDRHADAVQPARHLVAAPAELAARVERGHHDLGGRLALVLRVLVDRDAAAVVGDADPAVGEQRDVDTGAVAGHGLVDRVVDDLPHEVVEPGRAGRADVHARPLAHGIEPFEHLDVLGRIVATRAAGRLPSHGVEGT